MNQVSAEGSVQQPTQNQVPSQTWAAPAPAPQELGPIPGPVQQPPLQPMPQSPYQPALQPKQRKGWKITLIIIGIVAAIIAAIAGGIFAMQQSQQNDMHQIVHSKEADKAFRKTLKNLDPRAFTDKGVIQSYTIEDDTIKHNPMGGIDIKGYVNNDPKLYVFFTLIRQNGTGPLEDEGGGNSGELENLLLANQKKYGAKPSSYLDAAVVGNIRDMRSLLQHTDAKIRGAVPGSVVRHV